MDGTPSTAIWGLMGQAYTVAMRLAPLYQVHFGLLKKYFYQGDLSCSAVHARKR
jgi:hypothetical protein